MLGFVIITFPFNNSNSLSIALRLEDDEEKLRQVEAELAWVKEELRQKPKRDMKETRFAKLAGYQWKDESDLIRKAKALEEKRETLANGIKANRQSFMEGFSSKDLTVPLDPKPNRESGVLFFSYRNGVTYPRTVRVISNILGMSLPIVLEPVTISERDVKVAGEDQYLAKEKVVEAFEGLQKTLALKLKQPVRRRL
ncbi:MAG: hypothetical protein HXX80_00285 [Nitrososphaerales archaeon]|nr:hypothetical protein [Nitrososphaerales archaeon]